MLTIKNIENIKGKHFGDTNMRVWHVYDVREEGTVYIFYAETNAMALNQPNKVWFRLDREGDKSGSHILLRGTYGQGQNMKWISKDDIKSKVNLLTMFERLS